jgi:hypothetical protein
MLQSSAAVHEQALAAPKQPEGQARAQAGSEACPQDCSLFVRAQVESYMQDDVQSGDAQAASKSCLTVAVLSADGQPACEPRVEEAILSADGHPACEPCAEEAVASADGQAACEPCAEEAVASADGQATCEPCADAFCLEDQLDHCAEERQGTTLLDIYQALDHNEPVAATQALVRSFVDHLEMELCVSLPIQYWHKAACIILSNHLQPCCTSAHSIDVCWQQ